MGNKSTIVIVVLIALLIGVKKTYYIVTEGQQVIITEFGKPVGDVHNTAGLKFKKPWQKAIYVDKRILTWDGDPNQIPTKDKKYIRVDTTARWQIVNALEFIKTVQNEQGAKARLDTILDGYTRDVISAHNLVEAVRNSNAITTAIDAQRKSIVDRKAKGEFVLEEESSSDVELIEVGREKLSQLIAEAADKELKALGIKLIDVQLRRISYEVSVQKKVYERMISERQRIAQTIRSIGKGEKAEIEGRLTKDLSEIQSRAYRTAEALKGKAQGTAAAIYAKSLNMDPKFYEFIRSMEAYKKTLGAKTNLIITQDSKFLKFLK
jgi:membrane protease subunit HflC